MTHPLIGQDVYIEWVRETDDWHWYKVLAIGDGLLFLQGRDSPDGEEFVGGPFWTVVDQVRSIFSGDLSQ